MDLSQLGLFRLMAGKMDYLTQRQSVLAQNVANADTPDYRPNDLKPFDFRTALAETTTLSPRLTHTSHLSGTLRDQGPAKVEPVRRPYETKPDGNAVVLEEQMVKVADTAMDYETMLNLYRKNVGLIRTALGRPGGG